MAVPPTSRWSTTRQPDRQGAAGYADISKSQSGNVHFAGASGATNIDHQGRDGDIRYQGPRWPTS